MFLSIDQNHTCIFTRNETIVIVEDFAIIQNRRVELMVSISVCSFQWEVVDFVEQMGALVVHITLNLNKIEMRQEVMCHCQEVYKLREHKISLTFISYLCRAHPGRVFCLISEKFGFDAPKNFSCDNWHSEWFEITEANGEAVVLLDVNN